MMAKKNEVVAVEVEEKALVNRIDDGRPEHLQGIAKEDTGLDLVSQYVVPPFIKVVQSSSDSELRNVYNDGDVVVTPANTLLAAVLLNEHGKPSTESHDAGTPFTFTPLFMYPEWKLWNPIGIKPSVVSRSVDPESNEARCANRADLRYIPNPDFPDDDKKQQRYVEHLNYVVCVEHPEFQLIPMLLSFARGEHYVGQTFNTSLTMRRGAMYGTRWQASVGFRKQETFDWYGITPTIPKDGSSWVEDEKLFDVYRDLYHDYRELHNKNLLQSYSSEEADKPAPTEF